MQLKSFIEHFDDLRSVILRILTVLVILFGLSYFCIPYIELYLYKLVPNLVYIRIYEPILMRFTLMAWLSVLVAVPYMILEIFTYIKDVFKVNIVWITMVILLYLGAVYLAAFTVLPRMTSMLISMGSTEISFYFSALNYAQFAGSVVLVSALLTIFPILLLACGFHKIFCPQTLKDKRVYVFPLSFLIAAMITPPDVISQIIIALIIYLTYEIFLFFSITSRRT